MTKCYLCNAEIFEWEESLRLAEPGVITGQWLYAHEECQNDVWLEAQGEKHDN